MKIRPLSISLGITRSEEIRSSFRKIIDKIHSEHGAPLFSEQFIQDLSLAFTEGVANAIRHAGEIEKQGQVLCSIRLHPRQVEMRIYDHGKGFNIKSVALPRFTDLAESGRGIFMMRQLMDGVEYKKGIKRNCLTLKRNLIGADPETKTLDMLYEISDAILQTTDVESVYHVILDKAIEVFEVEKASILIYDRSTQRLKVVASRGLNPRLEKEISVRPGEGIAGYVFQHAKPCFIEDMESNEAGWEKKKHYKSRSFISAPMICSPMRLGQESIGVINMTDRSDGRPFTKHDLRLLTTIANQATAYLHICRLLSESKDAEIIRRELEIARRIQQNYLPVLPPAAETLDIAFWLETAQEVGGDYYDFIPVGKDTLYVLIADVSGHNVAAAMTMANFRSRMKGILLNEGDPGRILSLLNSSLFEDLSQNDQFITMVLLRISLQDGKMEVANAGHRSPLLHRQGKLSSLMKTEEAGLMLGADRSETYTTASYKMQPDDWLILYTDGVTECANQEGQRFGVDRLYHLIKSSPVKKANELTALLKEEIKNYRGGAPVSDDVSAVVLRFLQPSQA